MSKTRAAGLLPHSGRSKRAVPDHGVVRPSGHSFVTLLGLPTSDVASLRERIQEGLTYRSWGRFLESTGFSEEKRCDSRQPLRPRCRGEPTARESLLGPFARKNFGRRPGHENGRPIVGPR
jgi:hypothetical protein